MITPDAAPNKIVYRDATASDLESMSTMVPRSYDPEAFLPQVIPDTPQTRRWWVDTYRLALGDPAARVLVAVAVDLEGEADAVVVGILTLHFLDLGSDAERREGMGSGSGTSGITSVVPLTEDHSPILAEAFAGLKKERREVMGSEPHYLIELVGVDSRYQSQGIGRALTRMACQIADERDAAIYLQTSAAKEYYVSKVGMEFEALGNGDENGGTIVRARKSKRGV